MAAKGDPILNAYQKVGTKFIPPMTRLFKMDYISWSSQTMPEVVWWDVISDRVSLRFAVLVADAIAGYFKAKLNREHWWAFVSDYADLADEDAIGLREHLSSRGLLSPLTESLSDFLNLYPACPLVKLVGVTPSGLPDVGYLKRFEERLLELEDKRSRNGVLAQAQVVFMGFMLDRLKVKEGLALADFPEVENYPSSKKSIEVGASICAAVNMMAGGVLPAYAEDAWVQYFWNRSLELKPLSFRYLEDYEHTS